MSDLIIGKVDGGVVFTAKIVAASSRTALSGLLGGMLKVKVATAPQKGKANQRLLEFLAKRIGVKKTLLL